MFTGAIEKAEKFIRPLVVCRRHHDGTVEADGGTISIINRDGWFVGSARSFEVIPLSRMHMKEAADFTERLKALKGDASKAARKESKRIRPNQKWITASSIWPGSDGQKVVDVKVLPEADLFAARLEPFDAGSVADYPVFKKPGETVRPGRSLCKLGFSYTELTTAFDPAGDRFSLDFPNLIPCPVEGIFTRNIVFKTQEDRPVQVKFMETSSPALRGHAGAPVLDVEGQVWGIHSRTAVLPLDSAGEGAFPTAPRTTGIGEERTIAVSWAIHPDVIAAFLKEQGIDFTAE